MSAEDFDVIYRIKLLEEPTNIGCLVESRWLLHPNKKSAGGIQGCYASLSSAKKAIALKWRDYGHVQIWKFHVGNIEYPQNGYFPPEKVYDNDE